MGEVTIEAKAYAKLILHAAKYPHCAVNGILLADGPKVKDSSKNQDYEIVDAMPLFHHSHYVSPMAEVALTQIEAMAQAENRAIAGYYAACENFDNTIEKCPGQKIAEKIVEYFPAAVFVVIDSYKWTPNLSRLPVTLYKWSDGKWKKRDQSPSTMEMSYFLETMSDLLQREVQKDLVDFDNYLDDITLDWTNLGIEKIVASLNASNSIDYMDKNNY